MMQEDFEDMRKRLLSLSEKAADDDEPLRWFEELYDNAKRDPGLIPWATLEPNVIMMKWLENRHLTGNALVIGCGLGDDAIGLEKLGFKVTAFDISSSCITWCKERFPSSSTEWQVEDLLNLPASWLEKFDLVVEIHILQAIPSGGIREGGASALPKLLNSGGHLLCNGRLDDGRQQLISPPPWPLEKKWLEEVFSSLDPVSFELFTKAESPEISRYVASWKK